MLLTQLWTQIKQSLEHCRPRANELDSSSGGSQLLPAHVVGASAGQGKGDAGYASEAETRL